MAEVRGSWTLDEAIVTRWNDKSLDARFRDYWQDSTATDYQPLNDGEARPTPAGPYCVFEIDEGVTLQRHTGTTATTKNDLYSIPIRFRIHAKSGTFSGGAKSGKEVCVILAKLVAAAFDPAAGILAMHPDHHVYTLRQPDFNVREGDEEWVWVLPYDIVVDAEYDQ